MPHPERRGKFNEQKKHADISSEAYQNRGKATEEGKPNSQASKKIDKRAKIIFCVTIIALFIIFIGRWFFSITNGYFGAFVERNENAEEVVEYLEGLTLSAEDSETVLEYQISWDLYTSSRLRDEATIVASDGVSLHAFYYDEGSNLTVIYLPRYGEDGTADFLAGAWLYEALDCNIVIPDSRCHGESEGDYCGFGYIEQYDLADWIQWVEQTFGNQTIILWGEGTGANTILFAEASGILPDSVVAAVAESPYASLHELATRMIWTSFSVPAIPFLYTIEARLAFSNAGYTIADTDLEKALTDVDCNLSVMFLVSAEDEYILPQWSESVYNVYTGEKYLIEGGAGHGTVNAYCDEEIQSKLLEWINTD